ncbi:alpha/beta hydrolase [Patescibacteria group bacterium]
MSPKINCIIIHGCPDDEENDRNIKSRYDHHWIPWVKKELISLGTPTQALLMPEPWKPVYEKFANQLEKCKITDKTILIGHSCGCAFLVRWLGITKTRIRQLILVAPWKIAPKGDKYRKAFYRFPIDETIKDRVDNIIMFTSDKEEPAGKKSLNMFHTALGGKLVRLNGMGHYCIEDMGTEKFSELVDEIDK